ncbi:transmembrane protein, putative (macronuclear) [Tetrahymena thermophila SB210]|uniref:Transmembrane protein, putative n=1 Tax=Tetrahymena thermophila (strain SB210) TaxID=312017 RepID=I7MGS9_TETTS|nr:transmembrane protein, putative [Tetrahymena thermophila SB210]EAS02005.2 transmembrane protein, putative [Tetrahymena thermophila SB210]|eukprot:XP_001022250.2 transmembrane protein, putative [Tetrahymena thermophila SB210]
MNIIGQKQFSIFKLDKAFQSFYKLIVKSQLNCPLDSYILTIACFWIGFFQVSSIVDSFQNNGNSLQSSSISWNECWKVFIYFIRPVQFIYQQYSDTQQSINSTVIGILFVYLFFHAIIGVTSSFLISSTFKKKQKVGLQIMKIFVNCAIYFNSLLCIPIIETSLLLAFQGSLTNAQNQSTTSLSSSENQINKICGFILFALYQLYSFMCSKFYEVSYTLEEKGLQKYSQDNLSIFINHIRIAAVLGYTYDPQGKSNGPIIASCFSCLYFVLLVYEYFMKKPFSCISKSDNYLASIVTNFLFLVIIIFNKQAKITDVSISMTLLLLIIPIVVKLMIGAIRQVNDTYLYTNLLDENEISSQNDELLSRKISMLYNNRNQILQNDQLKLFGIYEQHKLNCRRQVCFCQYKIIKCSEDTVFLLNSDILDRYIRYLIRIELSNSNLNEKIDRLVHFIRYMTFLSYSKKHSFAISRVIDFINESERMRKTYGSYVKVCVDTILNELKQIMFKNIVQTIIDDEVEQQLVDIDSYIRMHIEKDILKEIIFKCIEKRIEIFEKMRKNFEDFTELEKLNKDYNSRLDELENRFHLFYERFPTKQNQSFYVFFQAEVKGNLKKAIQISNTRKFQQTSDNKKLFNVFEPNVLYLTATMGKIWGKIVNFSDKLPNALGYKKQEFNYVTHIKDIMPTSIATIHDEIIRCMMTQGNDSIINNKRQIFLRNKSNFLIRVNVFISMNLYYTEELPFGVFVTPIETRSGFLFVTSQGNVEGMDNNILSQVGYNNVQNMPPFYQFKISHCIPEFEHFTQLMAEQNLSLMDRVDVPFNFFARSHPQFQRLFTTKSQSISEIIKLQSQSSFKNYSEQESSFRQSVKKMGSTSNNQQSNLIKFKADLTIERHKIKMLDSVYVYYIVEIKYLMRVVNNDEFYTSTNKTMNIQGSSQNNLKSQFMQTKKVNMKTISETEILKQEKILSEKVIQPASRQIITEENTERVQQNQFLGIDFTNPDLKSSPNISSQGNNPNTQRDQQHFEVLPSDIREELNLDKVHVTQRQAANINSKIQNQIQEQDKNNGISFDVSQQNLDFSMVNNVNNPLLEYVQDNNQNLNYSMAHDASQVQSAHKLYIKEGTTRVSAGEIKEQEIAQIFMKQSIEDKDKQIEVNLSQANNNKKNEQKVENKKRSFSLPDQQERADLKVKLRKEERDGSLTSSTDALNRSMDKYNYYEEFISSKHYPIHLRILKVARFTEYLILLVATIASILTLYSSFDNLLQNIDSLTLHSNILSPYGNTICLSDTLYYLQQFGTPTQITQQTQIQFQREKNQYQLYSSMLSQEWQNSYLTSYFIDNSIDIYSSFQLNGIPYQTHETLLTASAKLLYSLNDNQQYTQAQISSQFYLPERQFLAVNYSQFIQFFKDVVQSTLNSSLSYCRSLITNIVVQTVILNIVTLFVFCLSGWNYYQFSKNIMSILKMCETASTISVENEMFRFQKIQEQLAENESMLFSYTFSIHQKELELATQHDRGMMVDRKGLSKSSGLQFGGTKRKKLLVNIQNERINYTGFALFTIFIYILFVIFTITTYSVNTTFLNQFQPAIQYYKLVSDSNFEISQLPSLKALISEYYILQNDVNKQKSVQYINTNLNTLKSLFDTSLNDILEYSQDLLNFNKIDFFDSSFKSKMDSLVNGNICNTSDDGLDNTWSPSRCQQIHQGILTQGLSNSISKWYDQYNSFKQLNYMDVLSNSQLLPVLIDSTYISITLSNYTTNMRDQIKNSMSSSTQNQKNINLIISLVFISIVTVIYFFELFKGMQNVTERFQMAKKVIFLLPLQTVMIEETFIKILKAQSNRLEIVK